MTQNHGVTMTTFYYFSDIHTEKHFFKINMYNFNSTYVHHIVVPIDLRILKLGGRKSAIRPWLSCQEVKK